MNSIADDRNEKNRHTDLEPIGVVDIGSNSVRLVIYEGAVRAPTPLFNEKEQCGLGRLIASTGKLGRDSVEHALRTLVRFRAIARELEVKHLRAFATAAVREASDGAEFLVRAEKAVGVPIQLLPASGRHNSRRSASRWASARSAASPAIWAAAASSWSRSRVMRGATRSRCRSAACG